MWQFEHLFIPYICLDYVLTANFRHFNLQHVIYKYS